MEIEYVIEEADLSALLDYHSHSSDALQELRRSQMYGYAILLAIFAIIFWFFGETAVAIAFLVLGPIWATWWPSRTRQLARRQMINAWADPPEFRQLGSHSLTLDGDVVRFSTPGAPPRSFRLSASWRVIHLPAYIFVYTSPLLPLIVPRRTSKGDAAQFVAELERRLAAIQPA